MSDMLKEFEKALRNHDWYYDYSDDGRVWRRGVAEADSIRNMREQLVKDGHQLAVDALWAEHCPWAKEPKS